jgi:hypothetical protein
VFWLYVLIFTKLMLSNIILKKEINLKDYIEGIMGLFMVI